ncbi:hypothetical protein ABZT08_03985 [Streptomyces sp. NPDC005526]|uniref:hypothetical protein n=1 Tax=Streptomyces sp. NPDC005526 TaxID=3156885 RepID=UPI0033BB000F
MYFEQTSALMTGAGVLLSEGLLVALIGTPERLEILLVGTVAVALVSLALVPFGFRLPARLRRKYEQAVQIDALGHPCAGRDAARGLSLRRTAGFVGAGVCWMVLVALASRELMPPVMLVPVAVTQWARSRATARWERENGAALWQGVPGVLGARGSVYRVAADAGT